MGLITKFTKSFKRNEELFGGEFKVGGGGLRQAVGVGVGVEGTPVGIGVAVGIGVFVGVGVGQGGITTINVLHVGSAQPVLVGLISYVCEADPQVNPTPLFVSIKLVIFAPVDAKNPAFL